MLDAFTMIFNWSELMDVGVDAAAYAIMALFGTALFVLRMVLSFVGDFADGIDIDIDSDIDGSADFSVFSIMSLTAFVMGTGWMGLAARLDFGLNAGWSAMVATGFGMLLMFGSAGAMYAIGQLAEEKTYHMETAVGKVGTVYLTIPGENQGSGQVRVTVSGRQMICDARTKGPELVAFDEVSVLEAREDGVLMVAKAT